MKTIRDDVSPFAKTMSIMDNNDKEEKLRSLRQAFGNMTEHGVAIIMKEAVRRAIDVIRQERFVFEATAKEGYSGKMDDLVTSADKAAQEIHVRMLTECFPGFGVIGEEDNLNIPSQTQGHKLWFTVDPLDGTKAFGRRQSSGIGTMISLVCDNKVIAAYVGDVMTQEIFGFRPTSTVVHRISDNKIGEDLSADQKRPLSDQRILFRDLPTLYSKHAQDLLNYYHDAGTAEGSIGLSIARLWKGEVGGFVLRPNPNTPWDFCPILGITETMGFVFLKPLKKRKTWQIEIIKPSPEIVHTDHERLIVHISKLDELRQKGLTILGPKA